ncbi:hypothetical protein H4219_004040 [Mycoemilia scoparia]|uniref:Uncharacterized protein n=1 Tax=Mycoemilia scoparia TaxID=417184 RepID=A0A9W7ZZJ7_9FUNG|nr:hypothetical protein H4219_004040 [Mycoemilia scoparia]
MSRFLSRVGTRMVDLENQLERTGSYEEDVFNSNTSEDINNATTADDNDDDDNNNSNRQGRSNFLAKSSGGLDRGSNEEQNSGDDDQVLDDENTELIPNSFGRRSHKRIKPHYGSQRAGDDDRRPRGHDSAEIEYSQDEVDDDDDNDDNDDDNIGSHDNRSAACAQGFLPHHGDGHTGSSNAKSRAKRRKRRKKRAPGKPNQAPASSPNDGKDGGKLGTWDGVFLPVSLTIWGIIVFVRMGYFVGQIGILGTAGSFLVGYTMTLLTTLSISAICTNGIVKAGGPYYMLSRSLGPEFGGSIGMVFFIGNLLSGVLNVVAFVEPLLNNFGQNKGDIAKVFPEGQWWCLLYNSILLVSCTVVCWIGARLFAKAATAFSLVIITSVIFILCSFIFKSPFNNPERSVYYTGWSWDTFNENFWPELRAPAIGGEIESFAFVFSIMFPACIGIMAGASMSGSLRKPSKSIPKGTLFAMLVTIILYLFITIALGSTTRRATLRHNYNVLQEINILPMVVPIGAIATSVTSTLSGTISSANILLAIAKDGLFSFLSSCKRTSSTGEPTVAVFVTYLISQLVLFGGDINVVAPYVTIFNVLMFGCINMACLVLKWSSSVNFRPIFRYFGAWTAFLGMALCFTLILIVDWVSSLVSIAFVYILFLYVHYTCPPKPWGHVTQSIIYHQVRKFLLRLDTRKDHIKFWRPQILLLVHSPQHSLGMIQFCNALKKGGLYVLGHVIKGKFRDKLPELKHQEAAWQRLIDITKVKAFLNLAISEDEAEGARSIIMGAGLGGMRPNIIIMGFPDFTSRQPKASIMGIYGIGENSGQGSMRLPPNSTTSGGGYDTKMGDGSQVSVLRICDDAAAQEQQKAVTGIFETSSKSSLGPSGIYDDAGIDIMNYVRIIEDSLLMGKAVGLINGFHELDKLAPMPRDASFASLSRLLGSPGSIHSHKPHSTSKHKKAYLDLWPIQIATIVNSVVGKKPTYVTNFNSYTMVLQMGTILHLVPRWREHYTLRVMVFVEYESEVHDEKIRVGKLLNDLRIDAELVVLYLRGNGIKAYDDCRASMISKQQQQRQSSSHELYGGVSTENVETSIPLHNNPLGMDTDGAVPATDFSMRINVPMPPKYEMGKQTENSQSPSEVSDTEPECESRDNTPSKPLSVTQDHHASSGDAATSTSMAGSSASGAVARDDAGAYIESGPQSLGRCSAHVPHTGQVVSNYYYSLSYKDEALLPSSLYGLHHTNSVENILHPGYPLVDGDNTDAQETQSQPTSIPQSFSIAADTQVQDQQQPNHYQHQHIPQVEDHTNILQENSRLFKKRHSFFSTSSDPLVNPNSGYDCASSIGSLSRKNSGFTTASSDFEFNDMDAKTQHRILNELMCKYSSSKSTALTITTLPAPDPGTSDSFEKSVEYVKSIKMLVSNLPPTFLVHATSLTVTTSL